TWEEVDNVPGNNSSNIEKSDIRKDDSKRNDLLKKQEPNSLNILLIADTIGSLFFILSIVFTLLFIYYKKKRNNKYKPDENIPRVIPELAILPISRVTDIKVDLRYSPHSTHYYKSDVTDLDLLGYLI
ncbi:hypothetical protein K502DRAFT_353323, partial [Neoconidiobolus thromboides FSU 785]